MCPSSPPSLLSLPLNGFGPIPYHITASDIRRLIDICHEEFPPPSVSNSMQKADIYDAQGNCISCGWPEKDHEKEQCNRFLPENGISCDGTLLYGYSKRGFRVCCSYCAYCCPKEKNERSASSAAQPQAQSNDISSEKPSKKHKTSKPAVN